MTTSLPATLPFSLPEKNYFGPGESFFNRPLESVAPSYLYQQYKDDDDLHAFVDAYNALAQEYVDWFNATALGLYTNASVSGDLLDWIGKGLYKMQRPYIKLPSGSSGYVSDDIYKRILTWYAFKGDGVQTTISWMRRRVSRFVYGVNGADTSLDNAQNIDIQQSLLAPTGGIATKPMATSPMATYTPRNTPAARSLTIKIPTSNESQIFQTLISDSILSLPFQINFTVLLT